MKRRSFLKYSSAFAAPVMLGKMPVYALSNASVEGYEDRVLVLIQLIGGNDGLATLTPLDHYDNLANVRSNIIIPENKLIALNDTLALHPELGGLRSIYDNAKLKIIQSVGYPDQNRSHFRSKDIWHSGSASNEIENTGWIGRFLQEKFPDYPENYPNEDYTDPFAITIGTTISETCQGEINNYSMVVNDPERINEIGGQLSNTEASGCAADNVEFIHQTIIQSNVYGDRMAEAYAQGNNLSGLYNEDNGLASQLKTIARLISGGLKTRVYVASLGGFDTHSAQVTSDDPSLGEHGQLMASLANAIEAFQEDLELLGVDENVIGMTYSEFGRRIRSNDSYGTDHGDAAPLFVFGTCVEGGVIGDNPEISLDATVGEAVPMQVDFRSVYGSIFMDWFGEEVENVEALLPHDFTKLDIAGQCAIVNIDNPANLNGLVHVRPNPTRDMVHVQSDISLGQATITILNELGKVMTHTKAKVQAGASISINISTLTSGVYFVRIQNAVSQKVVRVVKL